jgi:hypothetical protein
VCSVTHIRTVNKHKQHKKQQKNSTLQSHTHCVGAVQKIALTRFTLHFTLHYITLHQSHTHCVAAAQKSVRSLLFRLLCNAHSYGKRFTLRSIA